MAKSRLIAYTLAVVASVTAILLPGFSLDVFHRSMVFTSVAAVTVAALYGGFGPALVAAILTAGGVSYLLFRFSYTAASGDGQEAFILAAYVLVALLISALAWRRDKADTRRMEQSDWLQVILRSVADGVIVSDAEGRITFMNTKAEQVTGWTEAEARRKKLDEILQDEPSNWGQDGVADGARAPGSGLSNPRVLQRKDGSQLPIDRSSAPILDHQGKVRGTVLVFRDISERKKAQDQLQGSEQRFRMMADTAPVLIWMCGSDALCTFFNKPWLDFRGAGLDDELGTGWQRGLHPEDLIRFQKTYHSSVRARRRFSTEFRLKRSDGQYRWMQVTGVPLFVADEFEGFIGTCLDINDFKQAQEEIRESRDQLRVILNGIADRVMLQDQTGKLVFANQAAVQRAGYQSMEEMLEAESNGIPKNFDLFDEQGHPFSLDQLPAGKLLRGEVAPPAVVRAKPHGTGEEVWMQIKSSPIRGSSGEVQFVISIFHDITERKRSEEEQLFLAEASILLSSLMNYEETLSNLAKLAVPRLADWCAVDIVEHGARLRRLAVAHTDPEKVKWALEVGKRYPVSLDDARGAANVIRSGQSRLLSGISDEFLVEAAKDEEHLKVLRELGPKSYMCVPLIARGTVLGAVTFVSAESARRYTKSDLRFVEDLASRAAVAIDNARLYRQAEDANRLKDEFLATLSHELRTPLNAVLGWAHMLRTGRLDEVTSARAFESIERNAQAQAQLIADILDVSRIITGKLRLDMKPTRVIQVIESAIDSVRPAATAKGIPITAVLDGSIENMVADPDRLQQVVWNLLSNALKFTSRNGTVEIRLERHDSEAQIIVRDTGAGIASEFLPYVFDRFRQAESSTTRPHGGLGLGLAIVRHLVELHGGTVAAESSGVGMGSSFTVRFPIRSVAESVPGAAVGAEQARHRVQFSSLKNLKVLVVDDEADARELVSTVLEQQGARTRAVASASEAMAEMQSFKPDVLVSDIAMPGEDGYSLIRKVRALLGEQGGRIPAAALTAYARVEDRTQVLEAGFQTHVTKPVQPDELVAVVADLARSVSTSSKV